jgi:hypothetical protein
LVAIAIPGRAVLVPTLVAGPAQERLHLGLHGGLKQQAHRQTPDLLQDLGQGPLGGGEQLVDLSPDTVDRRYSFSHACRSSFVALAGFAGTYARDHLHQPMDATNAPNWRDFRPYCGAWVKWSDTPQGTYALQEIAGHLE